MDHNATLVVMLKLERNKNCCRISATENFYWKNPKIEFLLD